MRLRPSILVGAAVTAVMTSLTAPLAQAVAPPDASRSSGEAAVPAGFVASSTSWTSTEDGWVLGFAPCSGGARGECGTLVHTTDGGASWKSAAVPGVRVSPRFRQVRILFAARSRAGDPAMGLASDGTRLFVTSDGARTWQQASVGSAPSIGDFALTDTSAYAIVGRGTPDAGTTALFTTARGANTWAAVPKVRTAGNGVNIDGGYDLAARGDHGAVALGRIFVDTGYWRTDDGTTWTKRAAPCTSDQLPSVNWVGPHKTVVTCSYNPGMSREFKDVRESLDGGAFTTTSSAPVDLFTTATGAANARRPFIGATAAGVGWLYGTFDDGASWQTVLAVNDELPFHDLQFTDARHGFVVSGGSAYRRGAVYRTVDGGHTWRVLGLG